MSESAWAIHVDNVSKKFGLTLRQSMKHGMRDIFRKLVGRANTSAMLRDGEFWAVQNVSFQVRSGEALGIMGVNGCGKTTLLRMLNGVYAPDLGRIQMRGRVGALIAAGAGFAPMLSGRENIYVNGSLLGLSTKEIKGLMDEIIDFSGLEKFIDLPVKNYSSGMFVRLGFAIAALSRPNVLLVDEVLAVGDFNFQKKCFDSILQLKQEGTAIILISHAPGAIWSVCDKAIFMNQGRVMLASTVENVVRAYEDQNSRMAMESKQKADPFDSDVGVGVGLLGYGTGDCECYAIRLLSDVDFTEKNEFEFHEPIIIEVDVEVKYPQKDMLFRIIASAAHYRFIASLDSQEQGFCFPYVNAGRYRLQVRVHQPNFRPGAYFLNFFISKKKSGVCLFSSNISINFIVKNPTHAFFCSEPNAVMHLESSFELIEQFPGNVVQKNSRLNVVE